MRTTVSLHLLLSAIFTLVVIFRGASASGVYCQCHLRNSALTTLGISCKNGPSGSPMCSKEMRPFIPTGYQYIPGQGLYKLNLPGKSYASAQKACEAEGARLAIPQNANMADALAKLFTPESRVKFAFVGINDIASFGNYEGSDGELAPWLNWRDKEPSHTDGNEHCVHFTNTKLMNDIRCDKATPYICERKLKNPVPLGYQFLEGHGFYKAYKDGLSHKEAEAKCRADGAHLAVPETRSEFDALLTFIRTIGNLDIVWIGITDEETEGKFVTIHGTPMEDLEYANWADQQPDNLGEEDCVGILTPGNLGDGKCNYPFRFICELVI